MRCATPIRTGHLKTGGAVLACALVILTPGCRKRTVLAAPPVIVAPTPEAEPPATVPAETKAGPAPDAPPVTTPAPPTPAPRTAPRRSNPQPRTPVENPTPAPPKPPAPQISPQLSPGDQAAYERKTNEDIAAAEKNLKQAYGRELNAAQHDLVEKIEGFLGQAREAIRGADWARASNLAQKAYVLSVELVNSL